jgi:hypothetical protein
VHDHIIVDKRELERNASDQTGEAAPGTRYLRVRATLLATKKSCECEPVHDTTFGPMLRSQYQPMVVLVLKPGRAKKVNGNPPTPKRGALPAPKDVLDKAPRYTPERSTAGDQQSDEPKRSPDQTQPQGDPGGVPRTKKDLRQK